MNLVICPLVKEYWSSFQDLFGEHGAVNGCWCMYWRIGSLYRKRPREENKKAFGDMVQNGPPPGLLAFCDDLCVGWCQLTPRSELPYLNHYWRLKQVDDAPVWSISCFFIRKAYRKRGVSRALITAAIDAAKRGGAPALEAYPVDSSMTTTASHTGYVSTFQRAGFDIVAQHTPTRPIMRLNLIDYPMQLIPLHQYKMGQINERIYYQCRKEKDAWVLEIKELG